MRPEFKRLLDQIEDAYGNSGRFVDERVNSFAYSGSMVIEDPEECRRVLTRFFWHLYCPEVSIEKYWHDHQNSVFGQMLNHLRQAYGDNPWIQVCDQVRTGVAGGLFEVKKSLARAVQEDSVSRHIVVLVSEYRNATRPEDTIRDAKDYLAQYNDLLPGEMLEGSGVRLLANFQKVLEEHPRMIARLKEPLRRR